MGQSSLEAPTGTCTLLFIVSIDKITQEANDNLE